MFTGIVSDIGEVAKAEIGEDGARFEIASRYDPATIELGASIACNGCCLTVTAVEKTTDGSRFSVDASNETLALTTLADWTAGTRINLERALKMGDELGGHLVSGHVDGCAVLLAMQPDGESRRLVFESPPELARYIAKKGSVALNGVSLTVNDVEGQRFSVNVIPFTLEHTTLGALEPNAPLNLEVDMMARYVERLSQGNASAQSTAAPIPG
ncbi:Riboflavin synthase [Methyloligella halotolerans]|uniref:Riboflavin synthase n=1 Tax=Methyloligella halotolerans TaxID=1177755 RepID=A0A1E2S2L8_9HYPH|nr:riboflavin synthase [Methyloligella halotolerans]ODA68575.1 Riboflavin synthase [Methyloligella halotolerans]